VNTATRAPLASMLGILLAVAAVAGGGLSDLLVAACVLLVVLLLALGWAPLLDLPDRRGTTVVLGLVGLGTTAATVADGIAGTTTITALATAFGIFLAFAQQMVRHERSRLTESLSGTVLGVLLVASSSGWVAAEQSAREPALLVAAAGALAAAHLVLSLPPRPVLRTALAVLAGTAVATGTALLTGQLPVVLAALLGAALSTTAAALHFLLSPSPRADEPRAVLAGAAAPVALAGLLVLVTGRVLLP
jgi:iron complex transport system permease protein